MRIIKAEERNPDFAQFRNKYSHFPFSGRLWSYTGFDQLHKIIARGHSHSVLFYHFTKMAMTLLKWALWILSRNTRFLIQNLFKEALKDEPFGFRVLSQCVRITIKLEINLTLALSKF